VDPRGAEKQGLSVRFLDFLFYASFGFVVTSSVAIAGVLLVFCYLIVPSVGAMLYAEKIGPRLAIGWTMGTLVSALGVYLSLKVDRRHHRLHFRAGLSFDGSIARRSPPRSGLTNG
jgi:zinc/manganese transport system permease protein